MEEFNNISSIPSRGPSDFLCPHKESHQRNGSPARRHTSQSSYGGPALLARPGGLRNSRVVSTLVTRVRREWP